MLQFAYFALYGCILCGFALGLYFLQHSIQLDERLKFALLPPTLSIILIILTLGPIAAPALQADTERNEINASDTISEIVTKDEQSITHNVDVAATNAYSVYIPVAFQNYDPATAEVREPVSAATGAYIETYDGTIIRIPAGAFPEDGVLVYRPSYEELNKLEGRTIFPKSIHLKAITQNGVKLDELNSNIEILVQYTHYDLRGSDEFSIESIQKIDLRSPSNNISSTIEPHNQQIFIETSTLGHFSFSAIEASWDSDCEKAGVARGYEDNDAVKNSMCSAFKNAGKEEAMGKAKDDSTGTVHEWGGILIQDFQGGSITSPVIIYRPDSGHSYYMNRTMVNVYTNKANGPGGFLGWPSHGPRPTGYESLVDDDNNFSYGPIMYFDHGFIGLDSTLSGSAEYGGYEAHRYFPEIKEVQWEAIWNPTGEYNGAGDEIYEFIFRGSVNDVDPNPSGKEGDNPSFKTGYWVELTDADGFPITGDAAQSKGHRSLNMGENAQITFSDNYTSAHASTWYRFYFFAWREGDDSLTGYYYCNHAYAEPKSTGYLRKTLGDTHTKKQPVDCQTMGGGIPDLPPQLSLESTWNKGRGDFAVNVRATDDRGLASVVLEYNGSYPMELFPAAGENIYSGYIPSNVPSENVEFTVTATDTAGQTATINEDGIVTFSANFSPCCLSNEYVGNPVNTATGNDTDVYFDLTVPGRGDTNIIINRGSNSQNILEGPFGLGSNFEYDMSLEFVSNILLTGIQLHDKNGNTLNFQDDGNGQYTSISLGNFDYIEESGTNYILHRKNRYAYHFDANGKLISVVNPSGHAINLTYEDNKISKITNASNRSVEIYWSDNFITEIRAGEGKILKYQYENNLLRYFTDVNGGTTEYQYDSNNHLIAIISPNGYPTKRQAIDDRGRVIWQVVGEAERREFSYDDDTRTTTVTDSEGNTSTYIYDENYLIQSVTDSRNNTEYHIHDEQGNKTKYIDKRGNTWLYDYDKNGNKIYQSEPAQPDDLYSPYKEDITRWLFNDQSDVISMTNAIGDTTLYEYDDHGNLLYSYLPDGAVISMTYNVYGQLLTRQDGEGNLITNVYDETTGNLIEIIDGENNRTQFIHDELGRDIEIIDAEGQSIGITYDGNDNITAMRDSKGISATFQYDGNDNLIYQYDRRGSVTEYGYDESDRLIYTVDQEGSRLAYAYNTMGYTTIMTNPRGFATEYRYDGNYNVIGEKDEAGQWWYSTYDENDNMLTRTDPKGHTTRYQYDALNRLKYQYDALNQQTEYCYNQLDQLIIQFDPRRAKTDFEYDPMGRLSRVINAEAETHDWFYDLAGNLIAETNGEQETARYVYDNANRQIQIINPLTETITKHYDGIGNIIEVVDGRNHSTYFGYDANNNLSIITDTLGFTTTLAYNPNNQQISISNADGEQTQQTYYADGLLASTIEPNGALTTFGYDPNKNLIAITNTLGYTTTFTYDPRDLMLSEIDQLGHTTTYLYDNRGSQIGRTDAANNTYDYEYDPLYRLISVTDPLSQTTYYDYDEVGNRTTITYTNGFTSTFEYNFINQMRRETDALGRTWIYGFDDAGRLILEVDGEWQATGYRYDEAGRLSAIIYGSSGDRVDFTYDPNGNQLTMTDWNGALSTSYDPLNRPITTTDYLSQTIAQTWTADGLRDSMVYPNGEVISYTYDINNRLKTLSLPQGQQADYIYNDLGYLTQQIYSNNTQADYRYDAANRLLSLHQLSSSGGAIAMYDFVLDQVGNRTFVTETRRFDPMAQIQSIQRQYDYDSLYRLIESTSSQSQTHQMNWTFDSVGNWVERSGTPETADPISTTTPISDTYEHSRINSLQRAGDWLYEYDGNGSRIRGEAPLTATRYASLTNTFGLSATLVISYQYDYENRLTDVQETIHYRPSPTTTSVISEALSAVYTYDGLGRRVAKAITRTVSTTHILTTPTTLQRFYVFDGLDPVTEIESTDGLSQTNTNYYWANTRMVAQTHTPISGTIELHWYHHDALGSIVAQTNITGDLNTAYRYDDYGQPIQGDYTLNRYSYTGQEWDEELNTYHFYARYYDPANGVWFTQDEYRGAANRPYTQQRYAYVKNNPANQRDIYGFLSDEEADKLISENAHIINEIAADYGVDPNTMAAIVIVEQTQQQDDYIVTDESTVDSRAANLGAKEINISGSFEFEIGRLKLNGELHYSKELSDLIKDYEKISLGPGQVQLRVAERLEKEDCDIRVSACVEAASSLEERIKRLHDFEWNMRYVAAELKRIQDKWNDACPNIVNSPALLATLYNIGPEKNGKEREAHSTPRPGGGTEEFEKNFGTRVEQEIERVDALIPEAKQGTPKLLQGILGSARAGIAQLINTD